MKNEYEDLRASDDFSIDAYESRVIEVIKNHVGSGQVLLALSGGVDSSVCAALLAKAIPGKLHCVFVDHGLMRKNEGNEVEKAFGGRELNFVRVDAADRFLARLAGVTDPEAKRKAIGEEFIRVFEEEARKLQKDYDNVDFLAQGTIFTDVTESGHSGHKAVKAHHNVGGLPENIDFAGLVEPLRGLYKNEVRELGRLLGLPRSITERQPFPGPGLAIRCLGEVTREKLDVLREADAIFREELDNAGVEAGEYFAIHTGLRSVGMNEGARMVGHMIALRAVKTIDLVTADWVRIPYEVLDRVSTRITSECPEINRVAYDITSKPPATIEWE